MKKYVTPMGSSIKVINATIANGGNTSTTVDLGTNTLLGYIMPTTWTAAVITFQMSIDGGITFVNVHESTGMEATNQVGPSRFVRVNPADWIGIQLLRFRSGSGGTPVNQGAERVIMMVTKAV